MGSAEGEGDAQLAARLAFEAGQLLLRRRDELFDEHADTQALKDSADALAQRWIAGALRDARPADAVLSEEADDDLSRLDAERVWIIDPLDGTREYARRGRPDWAVHVALWESGAGLTAGAIAVPAQDLLLATHTVRPPLPDRSHDRERPLRVVVSGSRTPAVLDPLGEVLPLEVTTWGSAGAKAARVITGEADLYLHDSALNEWDAAAPVAVAQAAGLVTLGLDGHPLVFNQPSTVTGGLVMGRSADVQRVLAALASLQG